MDFERVAEHPNDGAYRTTVPPHDAVVASRRLDNVVEAALCWFGCASRPPWGTLVCEIAVTDRFVYIRRRDGTRWRVPRDRFCAVRRTRGRDVVLRFGDSEVIVPQRPRCPILAALRSPDPCRSR